MNKTFVTGREKRGVTVNQTVSVTFSLDRFVMIILVLFLCYDQNGAHEIFRIFSENLGKCMPSIVAIELLLFTIAL